MKVLEFQQWSIFERNTVKYASRDGEKKNSLVVKEMLNSSAKRALKDTIRSKHVASAITCTPAVSSDQIQRNGEGKIFLTSRFIYF